MTCIGAGTRHTSVSHIDARWEYAKRSSKQLEGWKLRALEALVLGGVIYFVLPDAISELASLGIASLVGLAAFPVFEFAGNYFDTRGIALQALRVENAGLLEKVKDVVARGGDTDPPRTYIKESSAREVLSRVRGLKWKERDLVAQASCVDRWVQGWSGRISSIQERSDEFWVLLFDQGGLVAMHLDVPLSERQTVEPLQEGEWVEFTGQIETVDHQGNAISLREVKLVHALPLIPLKETAGSAGAPWTERSEGRRDDHGPTIRGHVLDSE